MTISTSRGQITNNRSRIQVNSNFRINANGAESNDC